MRPPEDGIWHCSEALLDEFLSEKVERQMEGLPQPAVVYLPPDQWAHLLCLEMGFPEQVKYTEVELFGIKMRPAPVR